MIMTLTCLKRVLRPGVVVRHRLVRAHGNAVALESIRPDTAAPSRLDGHKASEVTFSWDALAGAQLFTARGLTYRIDADDN